MQLRNQTKILLILGVKFEICHFVFIKSKMNLFSEPIEPQLN